MKHGKSEKPDATGLNATPLQPAFPDLFRVEYEVTLKEYDNLVAEIQMLMQQQERTYTLLVTLLTALAASQAILTRIPAVTAELKRSPYIFLLLTLVFLWFPVNHSVLNAQIGTIAAYIRTSITPRIRLLSDFCLRSAAEGQMLKTEIEQNLPRAKFPLMGYEDFRIDYQFSSKSSLLGLGPMWIFRYMLLTLPSVSMMACYVIDRLHIHMQPHAERYMELATGIALALFLFPLILAWITRSNLISVHRRVTRTPSR
jgi:hypothetical protein